jgi:exonuclease SbcC
MRPRKLELEGFGAYRERTTVDLADVELFAIVGATGHGKSTLIDAICFALYGRVPRHGEKEIAPAMTLGVNETKVSFTFDLGGNTYVATRVLRRKPSGEGSTTRAVRFEAVRADGTTEELAGSVTEFREQVHGLVGLDFDQFTKCVVLPQGQFAAFLQAPAGERVAILSALLELGRYDQMAAAARERAKVACGRREALEAERTRLGEASEQIVAEAQARLDALVALRGDTEHALERDTTLAQQAAAAALDAARARASADALITVHMPEDARVLADASADASADAERARSGAESAESRAAELEAIAAELPSPDGLSAAREAHTERLTLMDRIARGQEVAEQLVAAAEAAQTTLLAARGAEAGARSALDEMQRHLAHAELRATLRKGEPCPVCEQTVSTLPPKARTTQLTKARQALDAKRAAAGDAEQEATRLREELARADAQLAILRERRCEFEARLEAFPDLAAVEALADEVQAARAAATTARQDALAARKGAQQRARAAAEAEKALRRTEALFERQRDALVAAGLKPPERDSAGIAAAWDALAEWAADCRPEHEKRAAESADLAKAHSAERAAMCSDLTARAESLVVEAPRTPSVADLLARIIGAAAQAEHASADASARLARATELDEEIATTRARELVSAELGVLLDKRHFGQWLVDEALHGLVAGASVLLERLSGGQYALAARDDGELVVVDHVNADDRRSVRSLSGGETFQASLALALALSDRVATLAPHGAATLESIFLDEGFGTLDPETLDVVAGTIESLGQGERVIGVVTHVSELAERMPVRFRVRKVGRSAVVTREEL